LSPVLLLDLLPVPLESYIERLSAVLSNAGDVSPVCNPGFLDPQQPKSWGVITCFARISKNNLKSFKLISVLLQKYLNQFLLNFVLNLIWFMVFLMSTIRTLSLILANLKFQKYWIKNQSIILWQQCYQISR
jgi:hypothetical protein